MLKAEKPSELLSALKCAALENRATVAGSVERLLVGEITPEPTNSCLVAIEMALILDQCLPRGPTHGVDEETNQFWADLGGRILKTCSHSIAVILPKQFRPAFDYYLRDEVSAGRSSSNGTVQTACSATAITTYSRGYCTLGIAQSVVRRLWHSPSRETVCSALRDIGARLLQCEPPWVTQRHAGNLDVFFRYGASFETNITWHDTNQPLDGDALFGLFCRSLRLPSNDSLLLMRIVIQLIVKQSGTS